MIKDILRLGSRVAPSELINLGQATLNKIGIISTESQNEDDTVWFFNLHSHGPAGMDLDVTYSPTANPKFGRIHISLAPRGGVAYLDADKADALADVLRSIAKADRARISFDKSQEGHM